MSTKGPRSPESKAIYAFVQENSPVTQLVLSDHFRAEANAAGTAVGAWLNGRIANMAAAGFITFTPRGWIANPLAEAVPVPHVQRCPRSVAQAQPGPADTSVAQPRRVGMFGPVYQPPAQTHRAGSMDHATKPSLINGRTRKYRSAW